MRHNTQKQSDPNQREYFLRFPSANSRAQILSTPSAAAKLLDSPAARRLPQRLRPFALPYFLWKIAPGNSRLLCPRAVRHKQTSCKKVHIQTEKAVSHPIGQIPGNQQKSLPCKKLCHRFRDNSRPPQNLPSAVQMKRAICPMDLQCRK